MEESKDGLRDGGEVHTLLVLRSTTPSAASSFNLKFYSKLLFANKVLSDTVSLIASG